MARRSAAIRSRSRATVRANQRCRTRTFRFSPLRNGSKSLAMIGFRRGWRSYDGSTRLSNLLRRQTRVAIKRTRGGPEQTLAVVDEDTRLVLLPRTGTSRSEIDWPAEITLVLIARGKKSVSPAVRSPCPLHRLATVSRKRRPCPPPTKEDFAARK